MKEDLYENLIAYIISNQEKFYRIAYCYVYQKDSALDIVQNAICKALENYASLRNEAAVKTWFYRILINESLQYIRKSKKEVLCDPSTLKEEHYIEKAYDQNLEVYGKVCNLPHQMKIIVILHFFEELSLQEISSATGVNLSTVKTRLYKALRRLKCELEVEG